MNRKIDLVSHELGVFYTKNSQIFNRVHGHKGSLTTEV